MIHSEESKPQMTTEQINELFASLKKSIKHQDEKPLSFKEASAYLGFAPSYLYKLTSRKVIPHYKPSGKMLFFSKADLDDWVFGRYGDKSNCELRIENGDQKDVKGEMKDVKSEAGNVRSERREKSSKQ